MVAKHNQEVRSENRPTSLKGNMMINITSIYGEESEGVVLLVPLVSELFGQQSPIDATRTIRDVLKRDLAAFIAFKKGWSLQQSETYIEENTRPIT